MSFIPAEIIKKKKRGEANTPEEISYFIQSFTEGSLPDYQMSAWAMAICFQGMTDLETATLTQAMKNSGKSFDFSSVTKFRVDKHSTGGVGDKTSLILAPIAAAAGVHIPMIAGRGLGHTGGTLDKLESIRGFHTNLSDQEFFNDVKNHQLAMMGQTADICPADKKLYALRDVTGTVESLPLICGSIMSKKLAEDLTGLVLDVKFGSGAFMKTQADAEELAHLLKKTGENNGVRVAALITNMNQPLGRFIGNSLEVQECIEIMEGKTCIVDDHDFYATTRDLSLILAGYMIWFGNQAQSSEQGLEIANEILTSGKALQAFKKLCQRQGAPDIYDFPKALNKFAIVAPCSGTVSAINTEKIGIASLELGAGRKTSEDTIDYSAGIEFNSWVGQHVAKGDSLAYLYANDPNLFQKASDLVLSAISISEKNHSMQELELIANVIE